jgi:hypothetical protein
MKLFLLLAQGPTPPPYQLDGAVTYGHFFAVVLVIAISMTVVIGGSLIIITLLGRGK